MKALKNPPYIIVLILSYNGKHFLKDSVSSYLKNDYPNFDVVVIENGSTDGTNEYVSEYFPDASVLRLEENQGYSGGFNFGLEYAVNVRNADYVLVTNDDVQVDNNLINELVKVAETNQNIGFVTGKVYYYDYQGSKNILQTVGKKEDKVKLVGGHIGSNEEDVGQYDEVAEREFSDDVFMLVRKEVVEKTGGYDTNFFLQGEQADWQLRAKAESFKIYYTPYAKLWHKVGGSTGGAESPLRHFYNSRNKILLVRKNGTKKQFQSFMFKVVLYETPLNTVLYLSRGRVDIVYARLKGLLSGIIWVINSTTTSA